MKVIGLNKIVRDSFYDNIGLIVDMVDARKIESNGDFYLKDIGDFSKLDVLPNQKISSILNKKINIFSYEFEYNTITSNLHIQSEIETILSLNIDHSIIIIYILLYTFIFDVNSIINGNYERQKEKHLLAKEIVKNIFESKRISEEEENTNLRTFILEKIENNNDIDTYFSILLTYMQLLAILVDNKKPKEEIEKMVNDGLTRAYSNAQYLPFTDENVAIIITDLIINLIEKDIEIHRNILNIMLHELFTSFELHNAKLLATYDNVAVYRLGLDLIKLLLEKDYIDIALSIIPRIDIMFITELIQTLPNDLLYMKVKNRTLYQHLRYLAIIKGENPAFTKRHN